MLLFLLASLYILDVHGEAPDTLRLAQVVFRHGDRSASKTFPTDVNREDAWPQGFKQLTQLGMRQEYHLGQLLRRVYDGYLNSTYNRHEVYVQASDYDRTLVSSEAVLAGLYPPSGHQVWDEEFPWQPIPVHTVPKNLDRVLRVSYPCARYTELRMEALQTEEVRKWQKDNADILHIIRVQSGMVDSPLLDLLETVPDALFTETVHNMTLPEWVTPEIYSFTFEMQQLYMNLCIYDDEMVKLRGGRWVYEALTHMQNATTGKLDHRMKMFLYGGHDSSITAYLSAMKLNDHSPVPYSSFFTLELHEAEGGPFVRLLYKNDTNTNFEADPILLEFPGCPDPCLLADYKQLVLPLLVASDEEHDRLCADA